MTSDSLATHFFVQVKGLTTDLNLIRDAIRGKMKFTIHVYTYIHVYMYTALCIYMYLCGRDLCDG